MNRAEMQRILRSGFGCTAAVVASSVLLSAPTRAQQPAAPAGQESGELAQKLSNPISDLVSVPFQFNWEQDVGASDRTRFILNVQPVMPFSLSEEWNLIARGILPIIGQPELFVGGSPASGLGDVNASFFFSPSGTSGYTWGVGPVVVLPSTSEPTLGSGKWSAGATVVALVQPGAWTIGVLWNRVWSFAGDFDRDDVSQMFIQPSASFQATPPIALVLQSESTGNWEADDDDDTWTAPINLLVAKLSSFGPFPASYQVGGGLFVAHPDVGPTWKIRSAITLLLPRTEG